MNEICESAMEFPGAPDAFQRLWTPYRMAYINGENKPENAGEQACPFCLAPTKNDETGLIVARGKHCFVVMNLYPYNPGHLLVCPYEHLADLTDLSPAQREELISFSARAMQTLRKVSSPHGFNLGMNQGEVAGAGIAAHLHQHVVPRWSGDANFFPIIAQSKAIPQLLEQARFMLSQAW